MKLTESQSVKSGLIANLLRHCRPIWALVLAVACMAGSRASAAPSICNFLLRHSYLLQSVGNFLERHRIFSDPEDIPKPHPSAPLFHTISPRQSMGFNDQRIAFLDFLLPIANSKAALQANWPALGGWGRVFTLYEQSYHSEDRRALLVRFSVEGGFSFFNRGKEKHEQAWKDWILKNSARKNDFSETQTKNLRKHDLPYHSEFYRAFKLVGTIEQGNYEWNIVSFRGIKSIYLTLPRDVPLPGGITERSLTFSPAEDLQ